MAERLPKRLEDYLLGLAAHEGEFEYLKEHLTSVPFEDAHSEMVLLEGLYDRKLIYTQGEEVILWDPGNLAHGIKFKPSFFLAAEAKLYLEELPKAKWLQRGRIVLTAITTLGACAAVVNLILFIFWH